jgi:hypothetical protein
LRLRSILSSPLLQQAKDICLSKPYLRYSLAEVIYELQEDDDPLLPLEHFTYSTPTREDLANVRNIYAFFGYTEPIILDNESNASEEMSVYSDHFDPENPTAGRLHTPSESDNDTGSSIISYNDLDGV